MENDWFEYFVVAMSLVVTLAVGLYFSRSRESSIQEYMLGNRQMTALPISLSIAATYLSGSSMVSTCQEVYIYGFQWWFNGLNYLMFGIIAAYVFLPVSYNVKSASTFEFFHRRFNGNVRKYASLIYALETVLHTAMSQYIPAVSLAQATSLPVFPIACGLSFMCWLYTATGGLKAVTYADSVQAVLFLGCAVILLFVGINFTGGISEVWNKGVEGDRMEFADFSLRYDLRYSIPVAELGGLALLLRAFAAPSFHQRVVALPTYEEAKQVTIWSSVFTCVFLFFTYAMGMVVYAYFHGCDPVLAKNTTTSCWNTVACTLYEDLVKPFLGPKIHGRVALRVLQGIVLLVAVVSTAFILVIQNISSLLEATVALKSFTSSSSFVLYVSGMALPWVNAKGAVTGSVVAAIITCYVALGSQHRRKEGLVVNVPKILTTANCMVNGTTMEALNQTITIGVAGYGISTVADSSVPWYFRLSMIVYNLPGILVGLMTAVLVSKLTGFEDLDTIDPEMIVPQMRWILPKESARISPPGKEAETLIKDTEVPVEDGNYNELPTRGVAL